MRAQHSSTIVIDGGKGGLGRERWPTRIKREGCLVVVDDLYERGALPLMVFEAVVVLFRRCFTCFSVTERGVDADVTPLFTFPHFFYLYFNDCCLS